MMILTGSRSFFVYITSLARLKYFVQAQKLTYKAADFLQQYGQSILSYDNKLDSQMEKVGKEDGMRYVEVDSNKSFLALMLRRKRREF
ncbi:hypothetical protein HSX37_18490|uniref:hypothetical protein n=1 Tax=Dendrosporobacter quercicolus TaxID=146817 RepID=UPI0011138AEF|nr:hypothetical protein [Dendrosporobacter quercicolus]NSL50006.1 hypothetical protein [Dendrosporobacter quercicolus DSM 1736]